MKKRILAMFLACMMIFSVIAVPAFAEEECTHKNKTYTSMETGKAVPTVCTDGYVVCSWECDDCDATGYERITGAHSLTTGFVDATCTEPAKAGKYCTLCNEGSEMTPVGGSVALGHDWKIDTENDDYKAPTCDEPGKGSFYCTRCDATKPAEDIVPMEHSWDMVGIVEATCAHGAGIQYKCLLCSATKVVEFTDGELVDPAKGHTPGTPTDKDATCAEEGYIGRVLCTVCGAVVTEGEKVEKDSSSHTGKLVETLKAATCTTSGVGRYECEDCEADLGYMAIPASHTYDKGTVTKVPTCGKAGEIKFNCTVCKKAEAAYTKTIEATGEHTIVTGVIAATCTTPEKAGQYCSVCGFEKNMTVVPNGVDALNHNYVNKIDCTVGSDGKVGGKKPVLPTCTAEGWGYIACSRCGVLKENGGTKTAPIVLAKLPHSLGAGVHAEATCTDPAGVRKDCSKCDYYEVAAYTGDLAVDKLGHNMVADTAADRTATCYQTGISGSMKCNRTGCTYKEKGKESAKDMDNHGTKLVTDYLKKPTCTTSGVAVYTCSNTACSAYVEYKSADPAHTWDAGVVTTQPNCGTKKVTKYTCTALINGKACGATKSVTGSTVGEHTWVKNTPVAATCTRAEGKATVCFTCNSEKDFVATANKNPLNHNYVNKIDCTVGSDGKVGGKKPALPTCSATGWGYIACSRCGVLKENGGTKTAPIVLAKLPHTLGAGVHAEATCTDPAGVRKDCSKCDYYEVTAYTGDLAVDKLGHNMVADTAADRTATCYQTGISGSMKCNRTGCTYKEKGKESAKDMDNHGTKLVIDYLKKPTCTTSGVAVYTCSNTACSAYVEYKSADPAHTWDAGVVTTQPNCGTKKVTKYTCTALIDGKACGATKTVTGSTSGNHTWVTNTPVAATCTRAEGKASVCLTCNAEKDYVATANKNPLNHNYVNKIDCTVDKDGKANGKVPALPTCTTPGWGYIACSRCGDVKTGSKTAPVELAVTAHDLGTGVHAEANCKDPAGVRRDCADCDYYVVAAYTGELAEGVKAHDYKPVADVEATCLNKGWTDREVCTMCGKNNGAKVTWYDINPANHVYVLVSTLKAPTCTTVGVGQYACKNPECVDVTYFGSIAANHVWNEKEILVSESGNSIYNPCNNCDAVKVMTDLVEDETDNVGKILNSLVLDAKVQITGAVNKNVALAIQVGNIAGYTGLWIEVNGEKVTESTVENGVYTFIYKTAVSNIADTFDVIVKGEKYGVVCTSGVTTYNFDLLEDEFTVDALATTKIEGATAFFKGRGVLIGETVKLLYLVEAPEAASVVLKKYGTETVFATVELADLTAVDGVYVVEIEVAADDWDQVFSASVVDAEGDVISNTNYYSVAQYAANNIKGTDKLSTVLSAMMQAIAE